MERANMSPTHDGSYIPLNGSGSGALSSVNSETGFSNNYFRVKSFSAKPSNVKPPAERDFSGGEGVLRIVKLRDADSENGSWFDDNYWTATLLSVKGRALPLKQWVFYMAYVSIVVPVMIYAVPNYANTSELKGLQFPLTALGTALFLLMTFRTNSCYDRWWDGRKLWGAMGIRCLDMARIAEGWIARRNPALALRLVALAITHSIVFKKWLRKKADSLRELDGVIPPETISYIEKHAHPIVAVTSLMTEAVDEASEMLPMSALNNLETQMSMMIADAQGCLRIISTPMPFAYIVHLRSFMVLWLLALPFGFLPTIGYYTILMCAVVAYQLLGFEDIGVEIESPFGTDYNDLPCDQMCAVLVAQLRAVMEQIERRAGADALCDVV